MLQKSGEEFNVEKIPDSISLQKIQMNRYFLVNTNISNFFLSFAAILIKSQRTQTLTAFTVSKNVLPIRGDKLKIKLGTSNVECVALWSHDYMKPATFALSDITVNMTWSWDDTLVNLKTQLKLLSNWIARLMRFSWLYIFYWFRNWVSYSKSLHSFLLPPSFCVRVNLCFSSSFLLISMDLRDFVFIKRSISSKSEIIR